MRSLIRQSIVLGALMPLLACAGSINLVKGWNLVGNSDATSIDVAARLSDAKTIGTVWKWNRTTSTWAFYTPSMTASDLATYAQNKGYDVLTSINPKEGFWVNALAPAALAADPLASPPTPGSDAAKLLEADLVLGWNLVASADGKTPTLLNSGLSASLNSASKLISTVWAWDAATRNWRFYAPLLEAQGTTALSSYISSKGYLPFVSALSASDGFWLNIGAAVPVTIDPTQNTPTVTAITPATAAVDVPVTLTVTGQNLPLTAVLTLAEGACQTPTARLSTGFSVVCTPGATAGSKALTVYASTGGTVIDATRSVAVSGSGVLVCTAPQVLTNGVCTTPVSNTTAKLTDTGITSSQCYQAGSNILVSCTSAAAMALNASQDGMVGLDVSAPDNSDGKLGLSYSMVPNPAGGNFALTECVKDNITGLTWEGKTATGTRAGSATYANYGDSRSGDASTYVTAVNASALCGYTDWRLPTYYELQSLVDYSVAYPGPTIDSAWFPNTPASSWYWSASPYAGNAVLLRFVLFNYGGVSLNLRYDLDLVRLVR